MVAIHESKRFLGVLTPEKQAPKSLPVTVTRFSRWDAPEPGKELMYASRGREYRLGAFHPRRLRVKAVLCHREE